MTTNINDQLFDFMKSRFPDSAGLEIPPRVFVELGAAFVEFDAKREYLKVKFPMQERWLNPTRFLHGGMIAAMMDATMGPLSYLVFPHNVTTQLNISYLRPVPATEVFVYGEAWATEKTKRYLFMSGNILNAAGKMVAMAHATCQLVELSAENSG